jgi:hypothetical protein
VSWQGSGSQWRAAAVIAADVANVVLVAPGVLDDDKDLVKAVLGDDELPPQPVSTANAVSAAVTPAKRRRANASTFVASMVITSRDLVSAEAGR